VCEAVTRATLPAGSTLTNASGKASGWAIVLTFEETHAGATAQPREAKCKYTRDGDAWVLAKSDDPPEVTFCNVLEEGITARFKAGQTRPDDKAKLDHCIAARRAHLQAETARLLALVPFIGRKEYPVAGAHTALR
ncbi:MAG: hypothetical protein AB7U62_07980, partial [Pseudolabrys sp.]